MAFRKARPSLGEAALVERESSIPLRDDGGLRIAVVADTHSAPHPSTKDLLARERVDAIFHAGDIGDLSVLDRLAEVAPLFVVRGNIDPHAHDLPDVHSIEIKNSTGANLLSILLLHIAVNGPRLRADALRIARRKSPQIVVCGHSHVPFIGRDHEFVVFNPGSVGPRRFQLPILFGIIEIAAGQVGMRHVDCETGEAWAPSPNRSAFNDTH